MITLTTLRWVPPFVRGYMRDLRVRWALEEAGLPYAVKLIGPEDQASAEYRQLQPFGQIPAIEDDGLTLFESGAILLYLGERSENLLPADRKRRAQAMAWLLAALNSVEIVTQQLADIDLFQADEEWAQQRRPELVQMTQHRLDDLAERLGDRPYFDGEFTIGDLMMASVLRALRQSELLTAQPALKAFVARCEARPAFQTAMRDHLAVFGD